MYIETNIAISSIVSFSQYIINGRLITLIGEIHNKKFKCEGKYMSLNKYVENRLVNNDKAAVFLEFNKDTDKIKDLGSQNLIKTVKSLKKKGIKIPRKNGLNNHRIKSIDHRDYFFKSYNLYANEKYFLKGDKTKIIDEFILPYFYVKKKLINNDGDNVHADGDDMYIKSLINYKTHNISIDDHIFNYLKKFYIPKMEKEFTDIYEDTVNDIIFDKSSKYILLHKLQVLWANFLDFYIMIEIFNLNCNYNEIIILVGDLHYTNLQKVFKHFKIEPVNVQENYERDSNNCVETKIFKPFF